MKKLWKRYWMPSAMWARKIGDTCLLMIPVLEVTTLGNPKLDTYKKLLYVGLVFIKFLTNFSKKTDGTNK